MVAFGYMNDSIRFINVGTIDYIISVLNNFDWNIHIQLTYETNSECTQETKFLDSFIHRKGSKIVTNI